MANWGCFTPISWVSLPHLSAQITTFHQPRFFWNKGISLPQLPLGGPRLVWGRYNLTRFTTHWFLGPILLVSLNWFSLRPPHAVSTPSRLHDNDPPRLDSQKHNLPPRKLTWHGKITICKIHLHPWLFFYCYVCFRGCNKQKHTPQKGYGMVWLDMSRLQRDKKMDFSQTSSLRPPS